MKPRVITKKTMTVEARDGYDKIKLVSAAVNTSAGAVAGVRFDHYQGRNYRGNLMLDLDTAQRFFEDGLRFVEFQRLEVE